MANNEGDEVKEGRGDKKEKRNRIEGEKRKARKAIKDEKKSSE